jgi:hypothetical protein
MERIELASGSIGKADRLAVILIKPPDTPDMILIVWPSKSSHRASQASSDRRRDSHDPRSSAD